MYVSYHTPSGDTGEPDEAVPSSDNFFTGLVMRSPIG